ncbi:MAG: hypothetical protein M3P18_23650 [Actinomycetota bacterium]|nr:hypothetical protein [Actinomycetota bacterium]
MSNARLIIANPADVAAADQAAAALGPEVKVRVTSWVAPGKAYVVDQEKNRMTICSTSTTGTRRRTIRTVIRTVR